MRRGQTVEYRYSRASLLVGVLACLCFSAGEGLRLMPIASPVTSDAAWPNLGDTNTSLDVSAEYQYATCGLEKRGQSLTRRQQAPVGLVTSPTNGESFPAKTQLTAGAELAFYRSPLSVSCPSGRAPPSA